MPPTADRSLSLDVFRGMTVCFMIIVNTPGSGATPFAPLLHASWHGFTPTDLVFPSFLFAVGNAMSFTLTRPMSNTVFFSKMLRRTVLIFLLGFLMYWFPFFAFDASGSLSLTPIAKTRVMGVLQRIALCYLFASLMIRFLSTRTLIMVSVALLLGYWIILLAFGNGDPYGMTTNAGMLLDQFLLGDDHLYHGEGVAFDPEGILSTLPSIVNVVLGYFTGKRIREHGRGYQTIAELCMAGGVLILLSLCWNAFFPINKKLWTSPFVLLTSGLDMFIIATLIYTVEIKKWTAANWPNFFTVFGKNPLFIYLLSEVLLVTITRIMVNGDENLHDWVNRAFFQSLLPGPFGSLIYALFFMFLCWCAGWWLDKKRIYVRV